jgi:hypothetical protein
MIKIEGFTQLQRDLADRLWEMDTEQAAREFVDGLPKRVKREAWIVITMITAHELDNYMEVSDEVKSFLGSL